MSSVSIFIPKTVSTTLRNANSAKSTTNPTIAWVILCLAFSKDVLSPSEEITCIAPVIK